MRGGVLSDLAIKSAYPEFQAPNIGLASALEMIVMDKHEFTGIKLPKDIKRKRVSRFPINDIANLASVSGVDNKAKTLYASVKGYRKKLGSSNFDLEDRQHMFKELDKRMGDDYGMNQELKRRGGFVDIIDAKSAISQEQLVSNLAKQNINISKLNQKIRDSTLGLQRVESQLNSSLLSNLENAKLNSVKQNTAIAQDERFRRLSGGEVYYNALTQKDYNLSRTLPDNRFKALREGEFEKQMAIEYKVPPDVTMIKKLLKVVGAKDAKEYEKITGTSLVGAEFQLDDTTIVMKDKPRSSVKETRKDFDESALPEAPDMPNKMSEKSRKDPAVKDLPKDVEGNIDVTEYIKKREQDKMKNKSYAKKEEAEQIRIMGLSGKSQDKYTLTPSQYKETYGMKSLGESRDSMTLLGKATLGVRNILTGEYEREYYERSGEYLVEYQKQQMEDYEQETQLNLPPHGIDPFQD